MHRQDIAHLQEHDWALQIYFLTIPFFPLFQHVPITEVVQRHEVADQGFKTHMHTFTHTWSLTFLIATHLSNDAKLFLGNDRHFTNLLDFCITCGLVMYFIYEDYCYY